MQQNWLHVSNVDIRAAAFPILLVSLRLQFVSEVEFMLRERKCQWVFPELGFPAVKCRSPSHSVLFFMELVFFCSGCEDVAHFLV